MSTPTPSSIVRPPKVAVFLDYQNVHLLGRERFGNLTADPAHSLLDPRKIADAIMAQRTLPGTLVSIDVYRGLPSHDHHPVMAAVNDEQTKDWEADPLTTVHRRPLFYGAGTRAIEKGVDVELAVDLVAGALTHVFDVAVLFSSDTDLAPVVDFIFTQFASAKVRIEVAAWEGATRLSVDRSDLPFCHWLDGETWQGCRDFYDYEGHVLKGKHEHR